MELLVKAPMVSIILGTLIVFSIVYISYFLIDFFRYQKTTESAEENAIGSPIIYASSSAVINFFDTLGIGSFAVATAFYRHFKLVRDKFLPGTMNAAFVIPIVFQALVFINEVEVEIITLVSMLVSATVGATIGAGIVAKLEENKIRFYMSMALGVVVLLMLAGKFGIIPAGGESVGLTGWKLVVGIVGNFTLGVLMTIGIGLYAPCLALVYALGMSPLVAFPIMMGSCAFLMIPASMKFIKEGAYNRKATFWSILGGIVGVFIAVTFVKSLPLDLLLWLVILVVTYTSVKMFLDSRKG